jgi:hypothetical protein
MVSPLLFWGAAGLIAYVVGLTYVARQENRQGFDGWWPLALVGAPLGVALAFGGAEPLVWAAGLAFIGWVALSVLPLFRKGPVFMPGVVVRLIAGIALVDAAMGAVLGSAVVVVAGLLGLLLCRRLQGHIAGT